MFRIFFLLCFNVLSLASLNACTAFILSRNDQVFLCKNFDWEDGTGIMQFKPAGTDYYDSEKGIKWKSLYGSITFCYANEAYTLGGMNEKGLVIEELSTIPFQSQKTECEFVLNEFQWINYHLDNCATIEEVIQGLDNVCILPEHHFLHYILSDAGGDVAVIEIGQEGYQLYRGDDLPHPVLSNNPYANSIRYIQNFIGFGGSKLLIGSSASCDRFVTQSHLIASLPVDANINQNTCYGMLDEVRQQDTQWQIVYDIPQRKIYFRDKASHFQHIIYLDSFLENGGKECFRMRISSFYATARLNELVSVNLQALYKD